MSAPSKTDLMYEITYNPNFIPVRSPKVNIKEMVVNDEKTYIMKNHVTGTYFGLSEFANDIWNLIDGKRSIKEITKKVQDVWLGAIIRPNLVRDAVLFYAENGALEASLEPVRKGRIRVASAFEVDVSVVEHSKELVGSIRTAIKPLLRRPLLWVSIAFIAFSAVAFAGVFTSIFGDKSNFQIFDSSVVGFFFYTLIALMPVHIVHELAHGIALAHYGGTPGEMGTGLFYFSPMFYIDTTDAWTLTRRQRIMVYMAGIISTLLIGSIIVAASLIWQLPHVLTMIAFYCFLMSLLNLAPPFETDGYYVLSDLVRVPNLRLDAYNYLKAVVKRTMGKPVEVPEDLTRRKKNILVGYVILSSIFIAYLAFQILTFTIYMAQDTAFFAAKLFSAFLFAEPLTVVTIVVSLSTFAYFAMTLSGYGLMLTSAVKKATRGVVQFEAIHDRDLSVFLHLPSEVPKSVVSELKASVTKIAEKITPNFTVDYSGSICSVALRIGSTALPRVQIREYLRSVESRFRSMYQDFLDHNKSEILGSVGIYSHKKSWLTSLLKEMAKETGASTAEAKAVVQQIIERQVRTTFYLLNSAFGTTWTIELPPVQQWEIQKELLSTFSTEDLAVTDLYDDVENFKRRTIYGIDSLAKLTIQSHKSLQDTIEHPEKYHVVSLFEPVKSRLTFIGRTEEIEKNLPKLGSLFACQNWCGYIDSVLGEVNLDLEALKSTSLPIEEEVQKMKDGELHVLDKNLSAFLANEGYISKSLDESKKHLQYANIGLRRLEEYLKPIGSYKVGLFEIALGVNEENLKNLPRRFKEFKEISKKLCVETRRIKKLVEREQTKRERTFSKKRRKTLVTYPIFVILTIALASTIFLLEISIVTVPFLALGLMLQVAYWAFYFRMWRSYKSAGRYPSPAFNQIQLFLLAFTQILFRFVATWDILTPIGNLVEQESIKS